MRKILLWETIHIETDINLRKIHGRVGAGSEMQTGEDIGSSNCNLAFKTSQELRMLSSLTLNCQATEIVMNLVSQLSEL